MILNASLSILQVLLMGVSSFIVYKLVLDRLGAELLGVWSLVFSISSVANVANLGVASSLVKFIAGYHKDYNWTKINQLIGTGFCVVAGLMAAVILALYFFRDSVLVFLLKDKNSIIGAAILPLSLMSLWINTVAAIFLSVLDGFKETYIKNILYILSSLFYLGATFFLIPSYGILGLGYAQILQGIILLAGALTVVVFYNKQIKVREMGFKFEAFREIFSYSFQFQLVTIMSIIIEPTTKFFLVRFGSLADVGYFEMGNKLVVQIRQILVSGNQVIIPFIAQKEKSKAYIVDFYRMNFSLISILSILIIGVLAIGTPLISLLWIGRVEPMFVITALSLSFAHLVNLHTLPANFTNLGVGNIKHLIFTTLLICITNLIFGFLGGYFWGSLGVVEGWAFAVIIGSLYQMYLFRNYYQIDFLSLYNKPFWNRILLFLAVFSMSGVVFFYISGSFSGNILPYTIICEVLLLLLIGFSLRNDKLVTKVKELVQQYRNK